MEDPYRSDARVPVVVDLDGTLVRTDLLIEAATRTVMRNPLRGFELLAAACKGRSALKTHLAHTSAMDPATLPYNDELLAWLREQRSSGRSLVLATAAHRDFADRVAAHLGIFDEVLATVEGDNLKSGRKRDALVARFGSSGFDYVGDHRDDLPVWGSCARAHVAGSNARLLEDVRALGKLERDFTTDARPLALMRSSARLHQWTKNLLVFVPLLTSHTYGDTAAVVAALVAFVSYGLVSSGLYIVNDLADLEDDRRHPRKRLRPFASGRVSVLAGWTTWPLLACGGFALAAFTLPPVFVAALAAHFLVALAYTLGLKRQPIVDVVVLAALYTLRIVAGALAIAVVPSFWLLTFSMFFFLGLAFVKRYAELVALRDPVEDPGAPGRSYRASDAPVVSILGIASGYTSILVLALFIEDEHTVALYREPALIWLACPLLLYWVSRVWWLASRGRMHDDPVVFALRDGTSWAIGALVLATFAAARFANAAY